MSGCCESAAKTGFNCPGSDKSSLKRLWAKAPVLPSTIGVRESISNFETIEDRCER